MKKKKSRYKERQLPLSGAGLLFAVLFVAAFSFVYFQEETQRSTEHEVYRNNSGKKLNAPSAKNSREIVSGRTQNENTEEEENLNTNILENSALQTSTKNPMPPLIPKKIIAPDSAFSVSHPAVVAYAPSLKDREARGGNKTITTTTTGHGVKVVIIIDDLGNNLGVARELLGMDKQITFSVLPKLKYSKLIADEASSQNKEVILHLPMEPVNRKNKPGPGVVTENMTAEEIQKQVEDDIKSVPHIVGMNNHMGSKATSDAQVMESVLSVVKQEGLFYVDSVTSPESKGFDTAQKLNLPSAKRDVFLDGVQDKAYIKLQIKKLKELAKKKGLAVGIGHPHPETVKALKEMLPEFEKEGIQIVPASEVVK